MDSLLSQLRPFRTGDGPSAKNHRRRGPRRRFVRFPALTGAVTLLASLAATGAAAAASLNLVAYSTPAAPDTKIIKAFESTKAGKGWTVNVSYGPSGSQSRAIVSGLPADVAQLSLEPDVTRLVTAGLVDSSWNKNRYGGIVTDGVVVFIVRKGNPKHIETWEDLVKSGTRVVTPNPFSSGAARWNLLAGYGSQLKEGKTRQQAFSYLKQLLANTVSQDTSARNALQTFLNGRGDVLLDYESDGIGASSLLHFPVDYVVPPQTILIQNPIAIVKGGNSAEARAFVSFLYSPAAQTIFADYGYRPVGPTLRGARRFRAVKGLFTVAGLGGWPAVTTQLFDSKVGVVTQIEKGLGVSTSGG